MELLQRSEFTLCPRGYGRTSFRLYEAIQQRSIPIYVHDGDPWLPYREELDWTKLCICVDYRKLSGLHARLGAIPESQKSLMRQEGQRYLSSHFTMQGVMEYVVRKLSSFKSGSSASTIRMGLDL